MLRWRGGFAPNLRQTAEAAVLDALLPRADDSLAVARPARHAYACFCPAQRTNTAWKPQKAMLDKDLAKLGDGIWIECLSPDAVSVDAPGESLQIEARQDGEALSATVYVAFARTFEEVERTLDKAVERGYAGLRADVEAHWRVALQPSGVAEGPVLQDLLTIALCTAPGTGAVVRAPVSRPPLALCDARTGVWIAYALDRYTFHDAAARLLGFLAGGVRLASEPNRPRGSLPAALYADGKPATPDFVLDVEEAAWLVTALYRHGVHLDDTARAAWWTGVWPSVEAIGDLLASWRRADTGEPLPAYQPGHWRDGITMASVLIEYAGLESAAQIAQMLRKTPPPPWFERQRELDTLIRFRLVDQAALWEVEAPLAFWMRGVVPDYHPLWSGRVVGEGELRLIDLATAEAAFQPQWLPHPVWPDAYAAALNACAAKR
jgi:GH15 family glucan-1,4-alpha-glucosidase